MQLEFQMTYERAIYSLWQSADSLVKSYQILGSGGGFYDILAPVGLFNYNNLYEI